MWIYRNMLATLALCAIFAASMTGLSGSASAQTNTNSDNSAASSQVSDTNADESLRRACAEAVQELKAARALIDGQNRQIEQAEKLLKLQLSIEQKLREMDSLNESQRKALYAAIDAKDRAIAELESQNRDLRKRGGGFWGKVKIGVVAGAVGLIAGRLL